MAAHIQPECLYASFEFIHRSNVILNLLMQDRLKQLQELVSSFFFVGLGMRAKSCAAHAKGFIQTVKLSFLLLVLLN